MDPLQGMLGIKFTHLVAGIAGGTVRAFLAGGNWLSACTSVVVGSLTAAYITTPVYVFAVAYSPAPAEPSTEHAVGFLVGLTAMLICEGVLKTVRIWSRRPSFPGRQ